MKQSREKKKKSYNINSLLFEQKSFKISIDIPIRQFSVKSNKFHQYFGINVTHIHTQTPNIAKNVE